MKKRSNNRNYTAQDLKAVSERLKKMSEAARAASVTIIPKEILCKMLILLLTLTSMFSFGQFTKAQNKAWNAYNNKKFVSKELFMKDTEKAFKGNLIEVTEKEAECVGYFIGHATADGYNLKNRTYGQIWGASERFCKLKEEEKAKK
ncbi:hypothetical protein [Elizabethkingia anophelis]|uniref:hypothetical protein n=1 Tax=Elizabethkingia anophelis TaxID=1117645 RepID=UPI003F1B4CE3|nr:hypothetical protein [Elizabethkingia anophelis]